MTILNKGFDMAALRKNRAKVKTATDLVGGIKAIAPEVMALKVGQTAQIEFPKDIAQRKFTMQVNAKLRHLTKAGGDWAGRQYDIAGDGQHLYVQRGADIAPEAAKVRKSGGRKAGVPNKATTAKAAETPATVETAPAAGGALVTEHA